jgi:hypothetical protein
VKVIRTVVVLDRGSVIDSSEWEKIHSAYTGAIKSMEWPAGSKLFTLRKKTPKLNPQGKPTKQWNRNGVTPIKELFLAEMDLRLWKREEPLSLKDFTGKYTEDAEELFLEYPSKTKITEPLYTGVGDLDCHFKINDSWRAAIEWETGNISSSHRSMNKLCLALMAAQVEVAVLIVPSREMYPHLTDRIGNWMELSPYLHFWKKAGAFVKKGLLAVTVVEHDALTDDPNVPYIGQGKDGRSAEGAAKAG